MTHLLAQIRTDLATSDKREVSDFKQAVQQESERLERVTTELLERTNGRPEELGAAAVDYLNLTGHVVYAWLWWKMAAAAQAGLEGQGTAGERFYRAKLAVGRHFITRMLPRTEALERQIRAGAEPLMALDEDDFLPQG